MKKTIIALSIICVITVITAFVSCAAAPGSTNSGGNGGPVTLAPGIYVSTNGNDTNSGSSVTDPVLTIQLAISKAVSNSLTNVYVAAGTYSNGFGLISTNLTDVSNSGVWITNINVYLSGGWDASFSSRTGTSILNGNGLIKHIITIGSVPFTVSNVGIDGFTVQGGNANITPAAGGGLYIVSASAVLITNTVMSNNYANAWGGGLCLDSCSKVAIFADIISNKSDSHGGGAFFYGSSSVLIDSKINKNVAQSFGGGTFINSGCSAITQYGQVQSNTCGGSYGGGIFFDGNSSFVQAVISRNSSGYYGGGIYISSLAYNITLSGTVSFNSAGSGGGVCIDGISNLLTNLNIENNTASSLGGGIYLETQSRQNRIYSSIAGNVSIGNGGGIYSMLGNSNTIQSTVSNNIAIDGAGMYYYRSSNTIIGGNIYGNSATNGNGGGLYMYSCLNTVITANFYNNSSTNLTGSAGGAALIDYCTNTSFIGSAFTNNWSIGVYPYDNSVINLYSGLSGVMISNCTIGGSTHSNGSYGNYAIVESSELTGHIIKDNTFLATDLSYLYCDNYGSVIINNDDSTWTNINAASYSDAAVASGNKRVNLVFQLITGTVTLPGSTYSGKKLWVAVDANTDPNDYVIVSYTNITLGATSTVNFNLDFVTNGTWYLYAMIDMDGDEWLSNGDYLGFFGGTGKTAPGSPNATVATNQTNFNITLLQLY